MSEKPVEDFVVRSPGINESPQRTYWLFSYMMFG